MGPISLSPPGRLTDRHLAVQSPAHGRSGAMAECAAAARGHEGELRRALTPILNTGHAACAGVVGVRLRVSSKAIGDRRPRRECRRRVLRRWSRRNAPSRASRSVGQLPRPCGVSRLKVALKDAESTLPALDPTALVLCRTPADRLPRRVAKSLSLASQTMSKRVDNLCICAPEARRAGGPPSTLKRDGRGQADLTERMLVGQNGLVKAHPAGA